MSLRFGEDPDTPPLDEGAQTEYGKHLSEVTDRLASIAAPSNVPLTHVKRPNRNADARDTRARAMLDASNRCVSIDFAAPVEIAVRARHARMASIFEMDAKDTLPSPESILNPAIATRPPAPPGFLKGSWTIPDKPVVRVKRGIEEGNGARKEKGGDASRGGDDEKVKLYDESYSAKDLDTWWFTLGNNDYEQVFLLNSPDPVYAPTRSPLVDISTSWNWFCNDTYLFGSEGRFEDDIRIDNVPEDFSGMSAVMTEYLCGEWSTYMLETSIEDLPKHRFHVMFECWVGLINQGVGLVDQRFQLVKQDEYEEMDSSEAPNVRPAPGPPRALELREVALSEPFELVQAVRGTEFDEKMAALNEIIDDRVRSIVDWLIGYFLQSSADSNPILEMSKAYAAQKEDFRKTFWVDYSDTKKSAYEPKNTNSNVHSRYATWTTLDNQSNKWDGPHVPGPFLDWEEAPPPSPSTLHEFLFGVVLNRWLPWVLHTKRPLLNADGWTEWEGMIPMEEEHFQKWAIAFAKEARTNRGWRLRPKDMRKSLNNRVGNSSKPGKGPRRSTRLERKMLFKAS